MISGILFACQYLIVDRDEPGMAQELMLQSGFSQEEFLSEQLESDYENEKMIKTINSAFGNLVKK